MYEYFLFHSAMLEEEDLEDGEIEDDDDETEDCVVVEVKLPAPPPPKSVDKDSSQQKKKSSQDSSHHSKKSSATSSSSRKDKSNPDEDDFMSNIENAIAEGLKKSGIEPPMPNVKKQSEPDQEPERRQNRNNNRNKRRKRPKERKEQKRESSSRVSCKEFNEARASKSLNSFFRNDQKSVTTMASTWSVGVPATLAVTQKTTRHTAATTLRSIIDRRTRKDATSDVINTVPIVNEIVKGIVIERTRKVVIQRRKFV